MLQIIPALLTNIPRFRQNNVVADNLFLHIFFAKAVFLGEIQIKCSFFDNPRTIQFPLGIAIEIKKAAVMHQPDIIRILVMFPHPVLCGQLAIAVIFRRNIVALIIPAGNAINIIALANLNGFDKKVLQNMRGFVIDGIE